MRNGSLLPFIAHFSRRRQLNPTIRNTTWHNSQQRRVLFGFDQRPAFAQAGLPGQNPYPLINHYRSTGDGKPAKIVGRTNGAIAHELDISPRTVAKHLERAYRKLGVTSRAAAATRAAALDSERGDR